MSATTLFDPPKRLRCQDPSDSGGKLRAGVIYHAESVWTQPSGSKMFLLQHDKEWWGASRFIDEDGDGGVIDCAYEEPTMPARPLPRINDEVFDFDRYNSLAALPGIRR